MQPRIPAVFLLIVTLVLFPAFGQIAAERIDDVMNSRIRIESARDSRIMNTVHYLSDVYSPRMTGTPQLKAAEDWALRELESYGLQDAHLESWDFGFSGWQNERLDAHVISPYTESLVCAVMAWTPSTKGVIRGEAVNLLPPDSPTQEELDAFLSVNKADVEGKIVLVGKHNSSPPNFKTAELRLSDDAARAIFKPRGQFTQVPKSMVVVKHLTSVEVSDRIDSFLLRNGALARVYDAGEQHGVIRAVVNRTRDISKYLPTVVIRNEDYGRISRILADKTVVRLELNIINRIYPEGRTQFNVLAEMPGSDKGDELVMLGAHIDAHHLATGATDNAIGCAVMMEAVRILSALKIKPRRTIRIGLWSGEEQHVLGSQAYVKAHFGSAESPRADFDKLSAYFNLDTGTGRIRGMRVFGPDSAGKVLGQITEPFSDLGIAGAGTYTNRTSPGSDHAAFSVNGLPGVYIDQDPFDYGEFTWHTNLDTYERVYEPDARQAAIVIASAVYHLAMRDELLPRFTREQMPPLNYFPTPVLTPRRSEK